MAELAAGDAGRETVVADRDLLIDELVSKVVGTLGHGADKNTDAFVLAEGVDILADADDRSVEAERDLLAVGRQVVGNGVRDDLEELLLGIRSLDGEAVKKLYHQTCEPLERSWDADRWRHLDQHPLRRLDVNLQLAGLVDGRVQQGEQTLTKRRSVSRTVGMLDADSVRPT